MKIFKKKKFNQNLFIRLEKREIINMLYYWYALLQFSKKFLKLCVLTIYLLNQYTSALHAYKTDQTKYKEINCK